MEADIDFDIIKNDNDTFTVKYTPPGAGHYTIMVLFANQVRQPSAAGGRGLAWKRSEKAAGTELFPGQKAQLPRGCGVLCVCVCTVPQTTREVPLKVAFALSGSLSVQSSS